MGAEEDRKEKGCGGRGGGVRHGISVRRSPGKAMRALFQGHDLKRLRHTALTSLTPTRQAGLAQPKHRLFLSLCCLERNQARNSAVN